MSRAELHNDPQCGSNQILEQRSSPCAARQRLREVRSQVSGYPESIQNRFTLAILTAKGRCRQPQHSTWSCTHTAARLAACPLLHEEGSSANEALLLITAKGGEGKRNQPKLSCRYGPAVVAELLKDKISLPSTRGWWLMDKGRFLFPFSPAC